MSNVLSDQTVIDLLIAVGASPAVTTGDFDSTFEDLDLDSLARAEFAARVKQHSGVEVEDAVHDDSTPNSIRRLVFASLAEV
ncbi:hypothetical protein Asp14428_76430 [Actinoplanes sp. NBRC 14428]|uniref:Minimal PKS acyl carrier protein n=1 Tax=Pseudosporangium ferrugineum TaxID=439699 RepID=A0A2T0RXC3_9ACTN|nr:acyl carrier protein [Pseudosporangium ferrugineum]PRY25782.1 minimal PKS acyl carrier protein [Pseudosporangium ferrugineum]BCJ56168.1 hypothetical protein Asp14428_76430 [Actinoplanes sp. NBRC 14428]